jgi:hypothetical protein
MQVVNSQRARIPLAPSPCRPYLFTAGITQLRESHVPRYDSTHAIAEVLANTEPWRGKNCSRHQKWNSTVLLHGARDSDKNRNGTVLFFNDITAFNVVKYLILNNLTALRLRNA